MDRDPEAVARAIVDANVYMTLATADGDGRPWATPVWYAHDAYVDFLWVSRPQARHSSNLATRPDVGIVIFDSTVPEGDAQAVYLESVARELTGAERDRAIEIVSRRSVTHGGDAWDAADVVAPAPHRLYRATALRHYILGPSDQRVPVKLAPAGRPGLG